MNGLSWSKPDRYHLRSLCGMFAITLNMTADSGVVTLVAVRLGTKWTARFPGDTREGWDGSKVIGIERRVTIAEKGAAVQRLQQICEEWCE